MQQNDRKGMPFRYAKSILHPFGKVVGNDFMVINLNSIFFSNLRFLKFKKLSSNFLIILFSPLRKSKILLILFHQQANSLISF